MQSTNSGNFPPNPYSRTSSPTQIQLRDIDWSCHSRLPRLITSPKPSPILTKYPTNSAPPLSFSLPTPYSPYSRMWPAPLIPADFPDLSPVASSNE